MSLLTNVLKLWRTGQYLLPADSGFMVKHLFANGEPGFAKLDFSGFAGMYQDRARTIPYTAVEQPLGSFTGLNGVTATAPADVNRGVVSARVNLLTKTEQFSDAAWSKTAATVTPNAALAPNGTMTADKLVESTGTAYDHYILRTNFGTLSGTCTYSVYAKAGERSFLQLAVVDTVAYRPIYDLTNGVVISQGGGTATITPAGGGFYLCTYTKVFSALSQVTAIIQDSATYRSYTGDGVSGLYLWGASLTLATDAHLPYQWVNTATDYDTAGFPHYLAFNGTNTAYVTPSIDFTGTDKITVWAGIHKNVDLTGVVFELDNNTDSAKPGALMFAAPYTNNPGYWVQQRGTIDRGGIRTLVPAAPSTDVVSIECKTSAPTIGERISIRVNGAKPTNDVFGGSDGVASNYANAPIYIGARAGALFYFNGRLYNLIVRGAQSSLSQIEATENLIRKTMRLP